MIEFSLEENNHEISKRKSHYCIHFDVCNNLFFIPVLCISFLSENYNLYFTFLGSVTVVLTSGTVGSRLFYSKSHGLAPNDVPGGSDAYVDSGGSIVIADQGKHKVMYTPELCVILIYQIYSS